MSWWITLLFGVGLIGSLIVATLKWGKNAAKTKFLEKNIKAARTRKAIDREIQNLSPSELADRLRRGL